jgi:NADPH-dependent 2,4-dienoyl-CoA reductase/sulfur reductase-like enzyme
MTQPSTICIVGAGPAGMRAATLLAHAGHHVTIIDDNPQAGGQIWRTLPTAAARQAATALEHPSITFWRQSSVIAALPDQRLLIESPSQAAIIRYDYLIIATGARERLLPFPGWTLPGVVGIGGLQAMVKTGLAIRHKRILIAGTGPLIWPVAHFLRQQGAQLVAIAERQSWPNLLRFSAHLLRHPAKLRQSLTYLPTMASTPLLLGTTIMHVASNATGTLTATLSNNPQHPTDCDFVAVGDHLVPNLELARALGCSTTPAGVMTNPDTLQTSLTHIYAIGEARGIGGLECALADADLVAAVIAQQHDRIPAARQAAQRERRFATHLATTFTPITTSPPPADTIICRCEDVTHADLASHTSWRAAKLQTRCGMGPCQGRICGTICHTIYGWGPDDSRPPLRPARLSTLALLGHSVEPAPPH